MCDVLEGRGLGAGGGAGCPGLEAALVDGLLGEHPPPRCRRPFDDALGLGLGLQGLQVGLGLGALACGLGDLGLDQGRVELHEGLALGGRKAPTSVSTLATR